MDDKSNSVVDADLAKAQSATGIMEGAKEDLLAEPKEEAKSEAKEEVSKASEEDAKEKESEDEDDVSDDGKEDEETSKSNQPPAKNRSPLKAAFAQIGELQQGQKSIASSLVEVANALKELRSATGDKKEEKAEVKATVKDVIAKAKESGADAEWLETFANTIREEMKGEFEKELVPLKQAAEEAKALKDKVESKEQLAARLKAESNAFGEEWNSYIPDLKKMYPNATDELLTDARSLMRTLAQSKEYGGESVDGTENVGKQPMPLDYILYKEKAKFDTLLKVKSGKSGETGGKEVTTEDELTEDDIDLDPEKMNPAQLKRYEAKKYARTKPEGITIISR